MKTVELIVKGNVQRVGYRNIVSQAAFESGIKGYVKNLANGNVRIIAQGEKGKIGELVKNIRVKGWPINVENIEKKGISIKKAFERFAIIRADAQQEMSERADEAALYMHKMYDEMKGFRYDTNNNFCHLDGKYDKMSKKFCNISGKLDNGFDEISGKLDNMSGKLNSKLGKTNKILKEEFSKLSDALFALANRIVQH